MNNDPLNPIGPPPPEYGETVPEVVVPVVEEAPSSFLVTLDELLSSRDVLLQREANDARTLSLIENPDPFSLRNKLLEWAAAGFPDAFPVFSVSVVPPEVCSDGVARKLYDYIAFVCGQTLADKLKVLEAKLKGISVVNSFSETTITVHVMKATQ